MELLAVRVRRLPNVGVFRRHVFEVEIKSLSVGAMPSLTITSKPYELLRPLIGWDEAALVERRASRAWNGGVGPWCTAFTGE